jgi:hypothetical protein
MLPGRSRLGVSPESIYAIIDYLCQHVVRVSALHMPEAEIIRDYLIIIMMLEEM